MQDLKLALFQIELAWENPELNRKNIENGIAKLNDADLVILPEMFTTGFSMESSKLAEKKPYDSVSWMKELSRKYDLAICGSIIAEDNGSYFNRLFFVTPEGDYLKYDKRHLFRMAGEHHHFSGGTDLNTIEFRGWRIRPLICYDLRFPVWSRNREDYDLLIYVANWPKPRSSAWQALLKARAIENYAYCAGVNRVGTDGNKVEYEGASAVFDAKGNMLHELVLDKEKLITATLSWSELDAYRKKFPVQLDADDFEIRD